MTLLSVSALSHQYAHANLGGKHPHQAVLNDISLNLQSGETVALLGRSGCGKSTLARLLVGLESPTQGSVSWRGEPLATLNRAKQKAFRRDIQMVFGTLSAPLIRAKPSARSSVSRCVICSRCRKPTNWRGCARC